MDRIETEPTVYAIPVYPTEPFRPSLSIQHDDTKHDCRSETDSDGADARSVRDRLYADDHNDAGDQRRCNA